MRNDSAETVKNIVWGKELYLEIAGKKGNIMKKRILCYGDSNAWGYMPGTGMRYAENQRWPGIVSKLLADSCLVIEDNISGRTTVFDDPYLDYRNGKTGLGYALAAHAPLDLVILSLGTNDLKYTDAVGSWKGIDELLRLLDHTDARFPLPGGVSNCPDGLKVLVISPILIHSRIASLRPESSFRNQYGESLKFARYYEKAADAHHAYFMNAADYASPSLTDCVHMDPESHLTLGRAVTEKIREIFLL